MSRKQIFTGAFFLAISSLLSRILGLVRDHIFASKFGALGGSGIYSLDAYFAAFRIPDFIYSLLILGTISVAFVPLFTGYIVKKDEKQGFLFANAVLNLLMVFMLVLCVLVFLFTPWLMKALAPGFSQEQLDITIQATRIMLLSPILFSLSSIAQSIQNAFKTFFYYSLAPIVYNLSIIGSTFLFAERFGIYGVAWGVVFGALLHFLIQIPALIKVGYRYMFFFNWKREDVRMMMRLVAPRIVGVSAMQFILFVDTFIASTLIAGSLTIFNLAVNLDSLPMGIVGISFAIASFSTLSEIAQTGDMKQFSQTLKKMQEWVLLLILPATFGMFFLRKEITTLILQGGEFTRFDVLLTSEVLGVLVISLVAQSLIPLLSRAFYAWHDTKTPVMIVLITVFVHAILSFVFAKNLGMGVKGLAFSYTIAQFLNFILLILFIGRRGRGIVKIFPFKSFFLYLFASVGMIFVLLLGQRFFLDTTLSLLILSFRLLVVIVSAMLFYFLFLFLFSRKHFEYMKSALVFWKR